ncbi:Uncharacterised protein [Yersinia nurmii]|uniref:Uncharacterized protein n=1 Tax=Yersinia nurmii TaxID=685706 RepID=A0ABM9S3M9_9GAMM|nr:Uncharacterised protein [Yersinia nurmii]
MTIFVGEDLICHFYCLELGRYRQEDGLANVYFSITMAELFC